LLSGSNKKSTDKVDAQATKAAAAAAAAGGAAPLIPADDDDDDGASEDLLTERSKCGVACAFVFHSCFVF
jgi:hypothetical protein